MAGLPRSGVPMPFEGYPAYGAVHDVLPNQELRRFMFDFSRVADAVFDTTPPIEVISEIEAPTDKLVVLEPTTNYDPRKFYKIFDAETLGVSVVEMDPAAKAARQFRTVWEKQDFGAVENEAKNKLAAMPNEAPRLMFNRVEGVGRRLPGVGKRDIRQKIALMPDTAKFVETLEIIEDEADIINTAIRRRLKQFIYPWDIVPHLTFAVFRTAAEPGQVVDVKQKANEYLAKYPFAVRLGQLAFRHKSYRT